MAGLVAVSPYKNGPFDSRAKGVAEHAATEAYLKLKLGEWHSEAP